MSSASYRSPVSIARVAGGILVALALVELVATAVVSVAALGDGEIGLVGLSLLLLTFATSLAAFVAMAGFSWWAERNTATFDTDAQPSPGMAAAWWFIPGANLWKPYDTLSRVWSVAAIAHPAETPPGPNRMLDAFWATWVASLVLGRLAGGEVAGFGDVALHALSAASGLLGAWVVWRIATVQDEAAAHLRTA